MTPPPCLSLCPAYPGNPRNRIEGESPQLRKGHTVFALLAMTRRAPLFTHPARRPVCHSWSAVLRATCFGACTMPDALKLLTTRRSFKAGELAGPGPSAAEIDTLLTVASRVPDHGKLTPWRFIVFEGDARRAAGEAIAAAFAAKYPDAKPEHVEAERARLLRAPLVIAVVS